MQEFSLEIYSNNNISVALQVKEICKSFCEEYENLFMEWQEEIQKFKKGQKKYDIFSLGVEARFIINEVANSFQENMEDVNECLDNTLSIEKEVSNIKKRVL